MKNGLVIKTNNSFVESREVPKSLDHCPCYLCANNYSADKQFSFSSELFCEELGYAKANPKDCEYFHFKGWFGFSRDFGYMIKYAFLCGILRREKPKWRKEYLEKKKQNKKA